MIFAFGEKGRNITPQFDIWRVFTSRFECCYIGFHLGSKKQRAKLKSDRRHEGGEGRGGMV